MLYDWRALRFQFTNNISDTPNDTPVLHVEAIYLNKPQFWQEQELLQLFIDQWAAELLIEFD